MEEKKGVASGQERRDREGERRTEQRRTQRRREKGQTESCRNAAGGKIQHANAVERKINIQTTENEEEKEGRKVHSPYPLTAMAVGEPVYMTAS
jgi:hypothetical protein